MNRKNNLPVISIVISIYNEESNLPELHQRITDTLEKQSNLNFELIYVNDQTEWDSDAELQSYEYDESDYLIDSAGDIFLLTERVNNSVEPVQRGNTKTLVEILGLAKAHASQLGSCCVSKLYAPSINEAFKIVKSVTDAEG